MTRCLNYTTQQSEPAGSKAIVLGFALISYPLLSLHHIPEYQDFPLVIINAVQKVKQLKFLSYNITYMLPDRLKKSIILGVTHSAQSKVVNISEC